MRPRRTVPSACARRQSHGAAGIRAQRAKDDACGCRASGPTRRPTSDVIRVPRVTACAVVHIVSRRTGRKLSHVESPDSHCTGIIKPRQDGCSHLWPEISTDARPAGGYTAGTVEHVLMRKRHAPEWAECSCLGAGRIQLTGMTQCLLGFQGDEAIEPRLLVQPSS